VSWFDVNATTGALTYKSNIKHFDLDGLAIPSSLTINPNGKMIYVVSQSDGALCWFERDTVSGSLIYKGSLKQGRDGVTGLDVPMSLQITKDGKQLFSTGGSYIDSQKVGSFDVNASTGVPIFTKVVLHAHGCFNMSLAISPEGKQVYIAAKNPYSGSGSLSMILKYNRDTATGVLSYGDSVRNVQGSGCGGESFVTISPDGKQAYECATLDHSVCWYDRNPVNGTLSYKGSYERSKSGLDSLFDPICVAITPDGKQAYVASYSDNAIAWFNRDVSTGALTQRDYLKDGKNGVDGIGGILYVAVSPDGKAVYTTSVGDDAISWFARDVSSGSITYQGCIRSTDEGVAGLHYGNCAVVSPDSKNVYVSSKSDAISWFIVTDDATAISNPRQNNARRPYFTMFHNSIRITLSDDTRALNLKIFDIKGKLVSKIIVRNLSSGKHVLSLNKTGLHSGNYICEVSTDHECFYSNVMIFK
jgi:6-phosphogluconolactonase (cycloisomerase 2 family)